VPKTQRHNLERENSELQSKLQRAIRSFEDMKSRLSTLIEAVELNPLWKDKMNYNRSSAVQRLVKNGIDIEGNVIVIRKDRHIGNRLWGVIDYLTRKCGFIWTREKS